MYPILRPFCSQLLSDFAELGAPAMARPEGRRTRRAHEEAWSPEWRQLCLAAKLCRKACGLVVLTGRSCRSWTRCSCLSWPPAGSLSGSRCIHRACAAVCPARSSRRVCAQSAGAQYIVLQEHPLQACVTASDLNCPHCPAAFAAPSPPREVRVF